MGDDVPPLSAPMTAAGIAPRVRAALEAADVEQFAALLSPDITWGPPGCATPPCLSRRRVLAWYAKGRARGRRATVTEVEVHGNALLVGLRLDDGGERFQIMRVGEDWSQRHPGLRQPAERAIGSLTWSRADAPPEATTM